MCSRSSSTWPSDDSTGSPPQVRQIPPYAMGVTSKLVIEDESLVNSFDPCMDSHCLLITCPTGTASAIAANEAAEKEMEVQRLNAELESTQVRCRGMGTLLSGGFCMRGALTGGSRLCLDFVAYRSV